MKSFLLSILISLTLRPTYASGNLSYHCHGETNKGRVEMSVIEIYRETFIMLVQLNNQFLYDKDVRMIKEINGALSFESDEYRNQRGAPSSLILRLFDKEGDLLAVASEVSYLPVFIIDGLLECEKFENK